MLTVLLTLGLVTAQALPSPSVGATPLSAPDSVAAVAAAATALHSGRRPSRQYRVLAFKRDSAGAVITLIPVCPPRHGCAGGGGRVRVPSTGPATVLERFR